MFAAHPGSTKGYSYNWADSSAQPGQTYYYWLEDVDINGITRLNGPIEALCIGPTASTWPSW